MHTDPAHDLNLRHIVLNQAISGSLGSRLQSSRTSLLVDLNSMNGDLDK